jgi:integrase
MAGTIRKRAWTTRKGEAKTAWTANYPDQTGKWHLKTFTTKKAADRWLTSAKKEVFDGTHTPDSATATVADAAELWLQRCRTNNLERGTLRAYDQLVRLGILPLIGEERVSRLSRGRVEQFRDQLLDRFAYLRARRVMVALRAILGHAQACALVAQNVAAEVRVTPRRRLQQKLIGGRTIPTRAEVSRLIETATGWRQAMVTLAAFTGMREAELRGLFWADVDLRAERVTVRQRADQWGSLDVPKTHAGQRTIELAPAAVSLLKRWKLECGDMVRVFPSRSKKGAVIGQSGVTEAFRELQRKAGIVEDTGGEPRYTFHALRHFFASVMIELGYGSKWLQVAMGHEDIKLTLGTYGHLFPETTDAKARMQAFEASVFGS